MPFRITTKNVCNLPEDGERLIQRKKNSKADVSIHELVPMTQPKSKRNAFPFDYGIKEMINVVAVQSWSYGCTWEVC